MNIEKLIRQWLPIFVVGAAVEGWAAGINAGQTWSGTAVSEKSRQTWKVDVKITAVSPAGEVRGEMACPALNSVNAIRGMVAGSTLTFTETEAIKKGGAHLGVEYAMIIDRGSLRGRWIEPGRDWGTIDLTAGASKPESRPEPVFSARTKFGGTVYSEKGRRNFNAAIEITAIDAGSGALQGKMTWPDLNSVHKIEGRVDGNSMAFKETAAIQKGGAHLNCEYKLTLQGAKLTGSWQEPGYDKGTVSFSKQ